jgi:hypothetical protein
MQLRINDIYINILVVIISAAVFPYQPTSAISQTLGSSEDSGLNTIKVWRI